MSSVHGRAFTARAGAAAPRVGGGAPAARATRAAVSSAKAAARCVPKRTSLPKQLGSRGAVWSAALRGQARKAAGLQRRQQGRAVRAVSEDAEGQVKFGKHIEEAAKHLVDSYVRSDQVIGVGVSGPACRAALAYIAKQMNTGYLKNIKVVPMSNTAAMETASCGIPMTTLEAKPELDFAFDYVDEVDENEGTLPVMKGRFSEPVQPNLAKERAVMKAAKIFVGFATEDAVVERLGGKIPVMINGDYWETLAEELDDIFIGDASVWRRPTTGTAPPHGGDNPYIGQDGENYLDVAFDGEITYPYKAIDQMIMELPHIYAHGLCRNSVYAVLVVGKDSYRILSPFMKIGSDEE